MPSSKRANKSRKGSKRNHSKNTRKNNRRVVVSRPAQLVVVGKIYATWCGHCKALNPEWIKLTRALKSHHDPGTKYVISAIEQKQQQIGIDHVNNTYLQNSGEKLALNGGYPTLFMIRNGVLSYYEGNRVYLDMLNWYTGKTKPVEHPPVEPLFGM
jgi:thiol-disulfide isomerase/thioredoxin